MAPASRDSPASFTVTLASDTLCNNAIIKQTNQRSATAPECSRLAAVRALPVLVTVVKGALFRGIARALALLPPALARHLARPLAWLLWKTSARFRHVSLTNLALCYPQQSGQAREQLAREALYHYACNALEVGVAWYWSRPRFDSLFDPPRGWSHLEEALAEGHGVLFLAPHFGAWEMLGLSVSTDMGATLYKPGSDPVVDQVLIERRERFGAKLVPAGRQGLKALMAQLKAGRAVGVLPDQEPRAGDGRFAPFFGTPALTGVLISRLIQRTGARAVFAACLRKPGGRFELCILPADKALYSTDLDTAMAALNQGVESIIALDPAQYLWAYKRFRARPDGLPNRY